MLFVSIISSLFSFKSDYMLRQYSKCTLHSCSMHLKIDESKHLPSIWVPSMRTQLKCNRQNGSITKLSIHWYYWFWLFFCFLFSSLEKNVFCSSIDRSIWWIFSCNFIEKSKKRRRRRWKNHRQQSICHFAHTIEFTIEFTNWKNACNLMFYFSVLVK